MTPRTRTRTRAAAGALTLAATVASCGLLAAPAHAAPTDEAAQASVLRGTIAGADLATVLGATRGTANPGTSAGALDVAALNRLLGFDLGGLNIPLGELVSLGDLGVASATSTATADGDATATAVTAGSDLDAVRGTTGDAAELDLTHFFASIGAEGLTDAILDEATLALGALGATATVKDGAIIDGEGDGSPGDYAIAGSSIELHSAAIGDLLVAIDGQLDAVGTSLTEIVTSQAVKDEVANGLTAVDLPAHVIVPTDVVAEARGIDAALAGLVDTLIPAEGLTRGAVTVRADGTIAVDLAQPHGGSLSGLPANTALLSGEVLATVNEDLTQVLASITDGLTEKVVAAISPVEVRIGADLAVTSSTDETAIIAAIAGQTVEETLAQLESLGLADVVVLVEGYLDTLSLGGLIPHEELLGETVGDLAGVLDLVQAPIVDALLGADVATGSADAVVPLGSLLAGNTTPAIDVQVTALQAGADVDGIAEAVTGVFGPAAATALAWTVAPATGAVQEALGDQLGLALDPILSQLLGATDALFDGIDEHLAVTLNHQPEELFLEGDSSFTVEAALVEVAGISLGLGSASVAADESWTTTISADPDTVERGDVVTVTGEGFSPFEEVTVTVDGTDTGTTTADEDGALIPFVWHVPEDASPGDVPVSAIGAISQTEARDSVTITASETPAGLTPTVRIPEQVQPGETVTVELEGWAPVEIVTLTLEEDGEPVTSFEPVETTTDEGGSGEAEIIIPTTVTPGAEIEVVGRGESGEGRDDTAVPTDEQVPVDPGTDGGSDGGTDPVDPGTEGSDNGSDGGSDGSDDGSDGGTNGGSDGDSDPVDPGTGDGSDGTDGSTDPGTDGSDGGTDDGSTDGGTDDGSDGTDGTDGTDPSTDSGSDGTDDSTDPVDPGTDGGTDGSDGSDGTDGTDGADGTDGSDGSDGSDGGTDPGADDRDPSTTSSVPASPADPTDGGSPETSAPSLARTGVDGSVAATVAGGGVLALLAGAALLLTRRRVRG
ncbi:choice-of-anchor G family protein [Microbacterium sp. NPDC055683]